MHAAPRLDNAVDYLDPHLDSHLFSAFSSTNTPSVSSGVAAPVSPLIDGTPSGSSSTGHSNVILGLDEEDLAQREASKRNRNKLAARKCRQKRIDRIAELEQALRSMTEDRDGLRLQLARREAEVEALREMLGKK